MNDGHILVIIIAAFIVVQTIAVGIYKYLRALADIKTMEAAAIDATIIGASSKKTSTIEPSA